MARGRVLTTDAELDAAIAVARQQEDGPTALSVEYVGGRADVVVIRLSTGGRLTIPHEELQGLEDATADQLSEIEIHAGLILAWPRLDVDHYLPHLLEHRYGSEAWMRGLADRKIAA